MRYIILNKVFKGFEYKNGKDKFEEKYKHERHIRKITSVPEMKNINCVGKKIIAILVVFIMEVRT